MKLFLIQRSSLFVLAIACMLPVFTTQAAGDAVLGKRQFGGCTSCHTVEAGGPHKIGPNLHGVIGKMAGSNPDFGYSEAMKESGVVWDDKSLDAYIKKPSEFMPGNKMAFVGVPKDEVRANIIAYLKESTK